MISQSALFIKLRGYRKLLKRIVFQYKLEHKISDNDISAIERVVMELDSILYDLSKSKEL